MSPAAKRTPLQALPRKHGILALGSLVIAAMLWLSLVHWVFKLPDAYTASPTGGVSPLASELAARQLHLWKDDESRRAELGRMRRSNSEWDFMGRSFLVWSLGEIGMRDPSRKSECLAVMDRIIVETLKLEAEHGFYFFLMPYAKAAPFVQTPARSLFVDSEIALMLGTRRLLEERPDFKPLMTARVDGMVERIRSSPAWVVESYPDECWLFDHAVALAAIRVADHLDGSDHSEFFRAWIAGAKARLTHPATGLLVSSCTTGAQALDGPEGSSIWMAAHCLRLVDGEFARDQYRRARQELGAAFAGFAWSREWPRSWTNPADVDSGAVIPILNASAGGSGLAFVGAASFNDRAFYQQLWTSVEFAGFPRRKQGQLRYCASNQVGDAVMLYAAVLGPVWERVLGGTDSHHGKVR